MEAFDMATFDDRDFKHIFNFLLQYKWVHDLHLTKFLESRVWEKIPDDWNELFSAMTSEELNCLPFHKADSQPKEPANSPVPESLMAFLQKSSALSHDRRQAKNCLPHPTEVSRDLSKGMSPKKLHEVEWMASLVNQVAVEAECNVVVDVGSGLGYLGQVLHKNYGLRVIGLESSAGHSEGAEKRAAKQGLSCSGVRSIPFLITDEEDNVQEFCSTVRHIAASFHPCEHSPSFQPSRSVTTDNATRVGQPCQPLSNKPETSEPTRCENKVMAGGDRRRCECDSVKHGVTGGTEYGCVESCTCKICYQSSRVNCECGETRSATSLGSGEEETARTGELKFKQTSTEVRDNSETRSATSLGSGEEETARTGELKFKQTSTEVWDNSETRSATSLGSGEEETARTGELKFKQTSTEVWDNSETRSATSLGSGEEETARTGELKFKQTSTEVWDNSETRSATSLGSGEEETARTGELKFKQTSTEVWDNSETRSATSLGSGEEETARTGELKFKQTSTEVWDNSETRSATSLGSGEEETARTGELKFKQTSTEVWDNSETRSAVNLSSGEEEATRTGEHTFDRNSTEDDNKTKSAFKLDSGKEETKRTDECNFEQSSKVKDTSQILAGSRSHNVSAKTQRSRISDNNPQAPDASHSLCFSSYSNTDNSNLQTTEETGSPNFSSRTDKDCRDGRKLCVSSMCFPSHSNTDNRNNSSVQATDDTGCHNFSSRTNKDDGVGNDKSSVQARDTPGSPNYSSRMDEDGGDGKNNSSVQATDKTGCTNVSSRTDKDDGNGKKSSVPARDVQGLRVCLIGLHCCGDLTPAMLRLYHRVDFLRAICCVSCCYHKMKLQPDCDQFINFPMSAAAKKWYKTVCADRKPASPSCPSFPPQVQPAATIPAPTTFLSPCSLRLAAQETRTRWASQKQTDHDSHARHVGYRAILELFFGEGRQPGQDRKSVRRLDYNNFNHFVESYLASANICDVGEQKSTREMLMALYKKFEPYFKHIEPYTCLQVILQPVLESTILWDRQQWLTEQGLSAVVMPIFDEHISPRNLALVSKKN